MVLQTKLKHADVTDAIIGAFFAVYNTLGYGFLEKVYRNSLALELRQRGFLVQVEQPIVVFYRGQAVGEYVADLVVANTVIVELKAAKEIIEEHEAQLLNYLKSTRYEVGMLLNFGPKSAYKRFAYDNAGKGGLTWTN